MIKKILTFLAFFIVGTAVAVYLYDDLFRFLEYLYVWSSGNNIRFFGKSFIFLSAFPTIIFGISFAVMCYNSIFNTRKRLLKASLWLVTFIIIIIGYTCFDSVTSVAACTRCDNGILYMRFNEIKINEVLFASSIISTLPYLFSAIRKLKKSK